MSLKLATPAFKKEEGNRERGKIWYLKHGADML